MALSKPLTSILPVSSIEVNGPIIESGLNVDILEVTPNKLDGLLLSPSDIFAVKYFRILPSQTIKIECINTMLEVLKARTASSSHKNIMPFAVVTAKIPTINALARVIVMPFYRDGNIQEYLRRHSDVNRMPLIIQITKAVEHLHSIGVVHGNICPIRIFLRESSALMLTHLQTNILVVITGHVVLADAGLKLLVDDWLWKPSGRIPIPSSAIYKAPEEFPPARDDIPRTTRYSGIYSWASVIYSMYIPVPFPNVRTPFQIISETSKGAHKNLEQPGNIDDALWALLRRCWSFTPVARPDINGVITSLETYKNE